MNEADAREIASAVDREVQKALARFSIQNGPGMNITGSGENMTAAVADTADDAVAAGPGSDGGINAALAICEDDGGGGFTSETANFVGGLLTSIT